MSLLPASFRTTLPIENYSVRYANELDSYAALKIFPGFVVPRSTGSFYQYNKSNLRLSQGDAASGTEAPQTDWDVFTNTFTCKEKAFKTLVLGKDERDFDIPVAQLKMDAAATNMDKLLSQLEDQVHTKCTTAGNYPAALTSTLGATVTWALSTGDPFEDVRLAKTAVKESGCGRLANTMALSEKGMDYLRIHPSVIDRVKYVGKLTISNEDVAAALGLKEIIVSKAVKNTAIEGAADVLGSIWDDDAVIFYKSDDNRLRTLTYGRTFMAQSFYSKSLNAEELGRGLGAQFLETGWELTPEFICQVSNSDADSCAGYALLNIF